jgi:hypothetical protein
VRGPLTEDREHGVAVEFFRFLQPLRERLQPIALADEQLLLEAPQLLVGVDVQIELEDVRAPGVEHLLEVVDELADIEQRFPALHYVFVDDKV